MHEVDLPRLIDRSWLDQRLELLAYQACLWLDPQIQFQQPVNPALPLVISAIALDVAQVQETPISVVLAAHESDQPGADFGILCRQFPLVPITCLTDAKRPPGQSDTDPVIADSLAGICQRSWLDFQSSGATLLFDLPQHFPIHTALHMTDPAPVSGVATPALRMRVAGGLVDLMTMFQQDFILPPMPLWRCSWLYH
jgi:hypothetical protein